MLVVSLLLNAFLEWTRRQTGTGSLRAMLYMDEVFGYLPPVANPPSKLPLLTLLKQARAFGVGIVLATQNPVDLDYKALSNTGTWFLGKLQTERDKSRVLDGLEGVTGGFDRATLDKTLSALRSRVFLMHNVHDAAPVVFETRWTLSYLRGPMGRDEIKRALGGCRGGVRRRAAAAPRGSRTRPSPRRRQAGGGCQREAGAAGLRARVLSAGHRDGHTADAGALRRGARALHRHQARHRHGAGPAGDGALRRRRRGHRLGSRRAARLHAGRPGRQRHAAAAGPVRTGRCRPRDATPRATRRGPRTSSSGWCAPSG